MSTDTSEKTILDALDFLPPCGREDCDETADYFVVNLCCRENVLGCTEHTEEFFSEVGRALSTTVPVYCASCHHRIRALTDFKATRL